jgi:Flp pilus assembly protein TadD
MEQSISLKPDYVDARFDYARLLTDTNRPRDAEAQANAVVERDPKRADAHELLGALLAGRGDLDAAARELQTAVQLQPTFARAQFELGMVLGGKGDLAGAREHLTIAAQSQDPQVSAAARQQLQRGR